MNREEAIKATKNGAIAACISGSLTLIIVVIAIFSNNDDTLALWNDPFNFFDILLIFACAYGIYKKSRTAAIVLFVYFIISKIFIGLETGKISGIFISLIFLYFYGKAIQDAFSYKKIEKSENPSYKPTPKVYYYVSIPLLIIFTAIVGLGLLTMTSVIPSTEVKAGMDVNQNNKEMLIANNIISIDDKLDFFYSTGFTSILEGGTVLTQDRVILYVPDGNNIIQIYELYFDKITSIKLLESGNLLNDSLYLISTDNSEAWLRISLSAEKRGDIKFIEALRQKLVKNP